MKVLGIVAEYNPFHNGHLYHLQASRAMTGADCVVAIMSGNYTQRGEPALVDKWARAEMALLSGVDLVIELPVVYAMASAEYFAFGAVRLLDSLGVVDTLCFGSEFGLINKLKQAADILFEEPEEYKTILRAYLSSGKSFPDARQKALAEYLKTKYGKDELSELLKNPNNILGVEYLKALRRLNSRIVPLTVGRVGNDYNSAELTGRISSATSIRNVLSSNPWYSARELLESCLPNTSLAVLEREAEIGRGPLFPHDFTQLLLTTLRRMTNDEIKKLPYMENGLENRIRLAVDNSATWQELVDRIGTRRYTATRVQRILFGALAGLNNETLEYFTRLGGPPYIRVLGLNETGKKLLSEIRGKAALPVITKTAGHKKSTVVGVAEMLRLEAQATDQYVIACQNPFMRKSGADFTRNVVIC
ncbi:MAG TPA: nucleotidyltransferase [Clostridia bacterium]|nr:nucleotidyltransferase [Clostridia bacterium]